MFSFHYSVYLSSLINCEVSFHLTVNLNQKCSTISVDFSNTMLLMIKSVEMISSFFINKYPGQKPLHAE